jgi:hypothetical protein
MTIARQRVAKHSPATPNTSVTVQRAVNTTIEEDMFSMGPPRDYINSALVNQKSVVEREVERKETWAVRKKGSAEDWLWVIVIDCD